MFAIQNQRRNGHPRVGPSAAAPRAISTLDTFGGSVLAFDSTARRGYGPHAEKSHQCGDADDKTVSIESGLCIQSQPYVSSRSVARLYGCRGIFGLLTFPNFSACK